MKMVRSGRATSAIAGVTICAIQHGLSASIRHSLSATQRVWLGTQNCAHALPIHGWDFWPKAAPVTRHRSPNYAKSSWSFGRYCRQIQAAIQWVRWTRHDPVGGVNFRSIWNLGTCGRWSNRSSGSVTRPPPRWAPSDTCHGLAKNWQPRASLNLTGQVDVRRLPRSVATAVKDGRRARVATLPPIRVDLCYRPGFRSPSVLGPHTD